MNAGALEAWGRPNAEAFEPKRLPPVNEEPLPPLKLLLPEMLLNDPRGNEVMSSTSSWAVGGVGGLKDEATGIAPEGATSLA